MKLKLIPAILLFISFSFAQEVFFCQSHTDKGDPINAAQYLAIRPGGDYMFILLKSEVSLDPLIYLFIDKKSDDKFEPYDSKIIRNGDLAQWVKFNYKFISAGTYKASFMNKDRELIAEGTLVITVSGASNSETYNVSSSYYDNCTAFFCERVIAEKPLNIRSSVNVNQNDGLIYLYLKSDDAFKTKLMLVDIWMKKVGTIDYNEYLRSQKFKVRKDWAYTFFKFNLTKPGDYKFMIYDENERLIKSAFIEAYN